MSWPSGAIRIRSISAGPATDPRRGPQPEVDRRHHDGGDHQAGVEREQPGTTGELAHHGPLDEQAWDERDGLNLPEQEVGPGWADVCPNQVVVLGQEQYRPRDAGPYQHDC